MKCELCKDGSNRSYTHAYRCSKHRNMLKKIFREHKKNNFIKYRDVTKADDKPNTQAVL
jgi:hypothetical protein